MTATDRDALRALVQALDEMPPKFMPRTVRLAHSAARRHLVGTTGPRHVLMSRDDLVWLLKAVGYGPHDEPEDRGGS